MRSFPSATPLRALAACAAAALATGVLAGSSTFAADRDPLHHKQHRVEHQIHLTSADLEDSSTQLRAASAALVTAQGQLVGAKAELADVRAQLLAAQQHDAVVARQLAAAQAALVGAQGDVTSGQAAVVDQRQQVVDTVTDIYEQGDPQLLAFSSMLQSHSIADITRRSELSQLVVGRQDQTYDDLRASEVLLGVREQQLSDAKDDVAAQKAASAEHVAEVQALTTRARAATERVQALVTSRRHAQQDAAAARHHDAAELTRLHAQDARIKQRIIAAAKAAAAAAAAAHQSSSGYTGPTNGSLLAPVNGPITSPYGYRINPIYGYYGLHDGTDFGVPCGTPMLASADGSVTSAYWSDVYGNRMYIDVGRINGHAVTINYNHATNYIVAVGDHVRRGQVIGYSGTTGWSTGCHLHFTVLVDGVAVDPMTYIG